MTLRPNRTEDEAQAACLHAAQLYPVFTFYDLAASSGMNVARIRRVVLGWVASGAAAEKPLIAPGRRSFTLVDAPTPKAPKQSLAGNTWTAMRRLIVFTPTDLAAHATTEEVAVDVRRAADYCRSLLPSRHLKVVEKAVPGLRDATYRLIRNTGPLPPREVKVRVVYDANLRRYLNLPEGAP